MKKFLVLGIGNAQVDLLKYLSNKFEVHALSNTEKGRGLEFTDFFEKIDITEKEKVLDYVIKNNIDYIYSIGSDVAMPTVSWVAEQANLPKFINYSTAKSCNNKNEFRKKLKGCYGSVPYQVLDRNNYNVDLELPLIIKPVDSQGQRGVSTVSHIDDLDKAIKFAMQYSRSKKVIAEKKILGVEVSVNAYVVNKKLHFNLTSDRVSWEEFDGGIIHKHIIPANLSQKTQENIDRLVNETIQNLNIDDGPVYFQIMIDNETPYLIEVTARFDGCHMWNLIKHTMQIDLLQTTIDHLVTGKINPEIFEHKIEKIGTLEFFCSEPNIKFNPPLPSNTASYSELYLNSGDTVPIMNGKMEKCGYQIIIEDL